MVKFMRGNEFCILVLTLVPRIAEAQRIPGRDLLEFPLGSLAEGPALSLLSGDGFRNPAAIALSPGTLARFTVSSLTTGSDQGVAGQIIAAAYALPQQTTLGVSLARASVDGIVRTESDPQSVGADVPYNTIVVSAHAAQRSSNRVTAGAAVRYHRGALDVERRAAVGLDAGLVIDSLFLVDGRLALSSFLWRPGTVTEHGSAFTGAFDFRVIGQDSLGQVRASYSFSRAPGLSREHFIAASLRARVFEGRLGVSRTEVAGHATIRPRFALGLRHGAYMVAVAREDSRIGLSPVYHFTLVATLDRR